MPISDKNRKLLWGKSGNRCALCRVELSIDSTEKDDDCIIGDECHIRSGKKNGPRFTLDYPEESIDSYENLLLLCKIHHKMIDDQSETYTTEILENIKSNHEKWVNDKFKDNPDEVKPIRIKRIKNNIPKYLTKLTTGKEILNIIRGSHAFEFDNDKLNNEDEVNIVAELFQELRDLGDIDLEPAEVIKFEYYLDNKIIEIEEMGFYIFGATENRILEGGKTKAVNFPVSIIRIIRKENDEIFKTNLCNVT
jgi:ribosomal protein S17E